MNTSGEAVASRIAVHLKHRLTFPSYGANQDLTFFVVYIVAFFAIVVQMTKRSLLGTFELTVMLALIRLGDNAYGIPISHEIKARGDREVSLGSIYATLGRLERKGLVSSEVGEPTPERGGRAKKYFRVTAKGLREIRRTQRLLNRLWQGLQQLEGSRA